MMKMPSLSVRLARILHPLRPVLPHRHSPQPPGLRTHHQLMAWFSLPVFCQPCMKDILLGRQVLPPHT